MGQRRAERRRRSGGSTSTRRRIGWPRALLLGGGLVLALALGITFATSPGGAKALAADRHALGDPAAPITVVEWADFQCPACARFALGAEPEIVRRYVDTGKVRYVARHFAFLDETSVKAAEASECASEQGEFWAYRKLVYESQAELHGTESAGLLKNLAAKIGLDEARFGRCLDSGSHAPAVQAEAKDALAAGANSTPTIQVDGQIVKGARGAPTVDELGAAIDRALAQKGR